MGSIERGFLALVGVGRGDPDEHAGTLADKVAGLRVFADDDGKMNLAIADVGGAVLVVSQFTLYGDTRKGRRPSFTAAEDPDRAAAAGRGVRRGPRGAGIAVSRGVFGADMQVELCNDGPVTLILDADRSSSQGLTRGASDSMTAAMWLDVFNANPYGTNCWLLAAQGSDDAVVVDPGFEPSAVRALLGRSRQDAGGGPGDARARRSRRGGGRVREASSPSTCTRPTRWPSPTNPHGTRASRTRSCPWRTCGRSPTATS